MFASRTFHGYYFLQTSSQTVRERLGRSLPKSNNDTKLTYSIITNDLRIFLLENKRLNKSN